MPFKKGQVANPVGFFHPASLITFGETVSGGAMITCLENSVVPMKPAFIPIFKAEFFKPIKEEVEGMSKCEFPMVNGKYDMLQGVKKKNYDAVTEIRSKATGELLGIVTCTWQLEEDENPPKK
jgi:hypothetical protein